MRPPFPPKRRLRCYSFDPSLAGDIGTWDINEILIEIPRELDAQGKPGLRPGPVGEYIEVLDVDPASRLFYKPVDLEHPDILVQDGLSASENNPQFHQQMVYAVAMATIDHFENAVGRKVLWSSRVIRDGSYRLQFVRRLRIYPHALRARNAYYSPRKKALLFGYFPVTSKDKKNTPGTTVFSCLSHDIIVHEMSHALLDGVHPRFNEPSNPDVHAFHEAFADIVAIFQRFSYPGILESQLRETRGDLGSENMLAQLAQQFGRATGRNSALRDALGGIDPETGKWAPRDPDPRALEQVYEPHKRGAILVAAVFRAFTLVYHRRVADLFRLSTGGSGILPEGAIHPDLVTRLAVEARETASRILRMCMRGLDYCPPVDLTFGDYLRAVITADLDIDPDDADRCRVAFVQSFREWGIAPSGVRAMSVDALVWDDFETVGAKSALRAKLRARAPGMAGIDARMLRDEQDRYRSALNSKKRKLKSGFEVSDEAGADAAPGSMTSVRADPSSNAKRLRIQPIRPWDDRDLIWRAMQESTYPIWRWLNDVANADIAEALNLVLRSEDAPRSVYRNSSGDPTVEVHAVRPIQRRRHRLSEETFYVVEVTQRRRGAFDADRQRQWDESDVYLPERGDFTYRAGSTFFLDPVSFEIDWVIPTAGTVADDAELERMRGFLTGERVPRANAFDSGLRRLAGSPAGLRDEPFALLHEEP
ncbi:hypothetical protein [Salipiger mangrovisoli]|uniref:Peptidase M4 n=1 Tax=Salipiger mangrovisoli TaxID=2865933 RepID=A0ABR9X1L4_9RHOB|nr:hypothetical protein [Salipiger mangrovisoli]MBE9637372.1 hypothetical protein [Salipiger mangrovisoli]